MSRINKRIMPTRIQLVKQAVVDWLLDLDVVDVKLLIILILVVLFCIVLIVSGATRPDCVEGYVYMRGICVQGHTP